MVRARLENTGTNEKRSKSRKYRIPEIDASPLPSPALARYIPLKVYSLDFENQLRGSKIVFK
jgi:hypothetical protein